MIERGFFEEEINESFESHPICALLGPRQCGKTTLSRLYERNNTFENVHYFDLEDTLDLSKLEHPKLTLEPLKGLCSEG